MATPVGTPPNLIGIGLMERIQGVHLGFFQWMALGVPIVVLLFAVLAVHLSSSCARGVTAGPTPATWCVRSFASLARCRQGSAT